ncbi:MAG: glycosyltransferase family 4 protein [Candidatus Omnitrophica bacterium]|nr:glycosyltransferase family 4 protein [Candidatus Omnitrophota bacterium]
MKIVVLSTGIFMRQYGQQRYELNFLNAIFSYRSPISFRIILLNDNRIYKSYLRLNNKKVKFITCGKRIRLFSKIKFVFSALFYSLKDKPDFLICAHINLCELAFIIYKIIGCPYIVLAHGTDVWKIKSNFKKYILIFAKNIICVSRYTANRLIEQIPAIKGKIYILANSVDTRKFFPKDKPEYLLKRYNLFGCRVILTVARLDGYDRDKGCDKVILSLPGVLKIIPNLKYILVGEGDDIPRIKKMVSELKLDNHIIFTGYISDDELPDYYNLCDIFIMPSKQEGFGIVFLEALACGKPVIAGNRDGSKEALLDGKLGILVDPDNISEIERAVISILKKDASIFMDREYLVEMVKQYFSIDRFVANLNQLCDKIFF